jgi:hypothetical protein
MDPLFQALSHANLDARFRAPSTHKVTRREPFALRRIK